MTSQDKDYCRLLLHKYLTQALPGEALLVVILALVSSVALIIISAIGYQLYWSKVSVLVISNVIAYNIIGNQNLVIMMIILPVKQSKYVLKDQKYVY